MAITVTGRANERHISSAILRSIGDAFGSAVVAAAPRIRRRIADAAVAAIRSSPEYASLLTDRLRGQLGVIDAEPVLSAVCSNIAGGVVVTPARVRVTGGRLDGGLKVELLKGDYSEVLGAPGASFVSEGGYQIDWLRWLTLEGDKVLVADYQFSAAYPERSRTGLGIMIGGGGWRVPPEFAGTAEDNWLTRALFGMGPTAEAIISEEIRKGL